MLGPTQAQICSRPAVWNHHGLPRRFGADSREYKYFILRDADLQVEAMQQAVLHLHGEHDFRNFCKVRPPAGVMLLSISCSQHDLTRLKVT